MSLSTEHLARCIATLEVSLTHLYKTKTDSIDHEIFRNAVIKGFELTLETAGKLLRKALKAYTGIPREIDALTYKDVLRHGAKHSLVTTDAVERWFAYRDNRNNIAHDYGKAFAEQTLKLIPDFIKDAHALEAVLKLKMNNQNA